MRRRNRKYHKRIVLCSVALWEIKEVEWNVFKEITVKGRKDPVHDSKPQVYPSNKIKIRRSILLLLYDIVNSLIEDGDGPATILLQNKVRGEYTYGKARIRQII
jgi:hypothetical protein